MVSNTDRKVWIRALFGTTANSALQATLLRSVINWDVEWDVVGKI